MKEWNEEQWYGAVKKYDKTALYLYTPMCGTCQVASKMLEVVERMFPDFPIGKANINYLGQLTFDYKIESVPCLLISRNGEVVEKVYAFQSIQNLLEKLELDIDEL